MPIKAISVFVVGGLFQIHRIDRKQRDKVWRTEFQNFDVINLL